MGFADNIKRFKQKVKVDAATAIVKSSEVLFKSIVRGCPSTQGANGRPSPYSNDLLINQWYAGVNEHVTLLGKSTSSTGADSLARIQELHKRVLPTGKDVILSLTNNLGYAYRVEMLGWPEGDGDESRPWKGAQPYSMVSKAVMAWKAKG